MKQARLSLYALVAGILFPFLVIAGPTTDPENYKPSPFTNDTTSFIGAGMMEHLSMGLTLSFIYERNPLRLVDTATDTITRTVVGDHLTADLAVSLGLFEWVDLGLSLPAIMFQSGEGWNDADGLPKGSLGDIRFAARARVFRTEDKFFSLSFVPVLTFPTGQFLHDLSGSNGVTFSPTLTTELSSQWVSGGLNLFYRYTQNDVTIGSLRVADQVGFRAQVTAFAIPEILSFTAGFTAATTAEKSFGEEAESPMEASLSVAWRYKPANLSLFAGGGAGIGSGFATPQMRFFLGIGWALPSEKEEEGKDEEKKKEEVIQPTLTEEKPLPPPEPVQKEKEPENVVRPTEQPTKPAALPSAEQKPKVVELGESPLPPATQPPTTAAPSKAPQQVSQPKQPPVVAPSAPKQPQAPVTPPPPKKAEPKTGTPMAEIIYFKENSTEITDDSRVKLEKVNLLLSSNFMLKVRIEGHADRNEKPELGLKRAQAIKLWLIDHDIASSRIQTKGMGAEEPVAPSELEADRARNRRVVFYVLNE